MILPELKQYQALTEEPKPRVVEGYVIEGEFTEEEKR